MTRPLVVSCSSGDRVGYPFGRHPAVCIIHVYKMLEFLEQSWPWAGSIHGLGWVGSKTMGRLTQSVSIDDVYKLNISCSALKSAIDAT